MYMHLRRAEMTSFSHIGKPAHAFISMKLTTFNSQGMPTSTLHLLFLIFDFSSQSTTLTNSNVRILPPSFKWL